MTGCRRCWRASCWRSPKPTSRRSCARCGPTARCASSTTRIRRTQPAALSSCRRDDVLRDFLATGAAAPGVAPRIETIAAAQTSRGARHCRRGVADQRARRRRAVPAGGYARCDARGSVHLDPDTVDGVEDADIPRPRPRRVLGDRSPDPVVAARGRGAGPGRGDRRRPTFSTTVGPW